MNLLAFDTSTDCLAVGLLAHGRVSCAHEEGGARASSRLLPCIGERLAGAGIALGDLSAVAFGRGPGAFTGLRTSTSVAQGLAFGLGVPVLPVDSLLVVAEDARSQAGVHAGGFEIGVAMDARMGEIYAARYRWHEGPWLVLDPPALYGAAALHDRWRADPPPAVAGSALAAAGGCALSGLAARAWPAETGRAQALLRLAAAAFEAGQGVDASQALPLYVRDKVALTTREREQRAR
jgi:tRNA threonylcarbamoyladenosine biosynthesis protein TsaB